MTLADTKLTHKEIDHNAAFNMGNRILERWGCSVEQKLTILGLSRSSYYGYVDANSVINLNLEQLERISCLANIHYAIRLQFNNRDNVYGFMNMVNHNYYFNGQTPLALITTGDLESLSNVAKHIESMAAVYPYSKPT